MPRPQQLSALDEPRDYSGDGGWRGVNMRLDPDQLEPGFCSKAVNYRFRDGTPEVRRGSMVIPWLNKITAGNVQPWGTVYGRGPFRDPATFNEYELVAADGNVYACLANNAPVQLDLPAGETVTARCTFLQAFNVVLLLRGFEADPLVMTDINVGFVAIEPSTTGSGLLEIPRCLRGVFMANRVFLLREDDSMVASDVNDYTHFSALNDFRINQGEADKAVALVRFGRTGIVVLKEKSVYLAENVYGNLESLVTTSVTQRYGCIAAESVVDCGSDVLWLTNELKVAGLLLTIQNEIQAAQGALAGRFPSLSDPMEPLFNRISGAYAHLAVAALWNDRYYIGLPVDNAEMFGIELVQSGSRVQTVTTVAGNRYQFAPGAGSTDYITNGSETVSTARQFVAQGSSVTLNTADIFTTHAITKSSLKRVFRGENNVLAHYDFINQAWGGYDEADSIAFKQLFLSTYVKRQRLFVSTHDGYVRLWEEDYADRLSAPYGDLTVVTAPATGNTLRVNGGTTITANAAVGTNTGATWGTDFLQSATQNLWLETGDGGFRLSNPARWTSPNAQPILLPIGALGYTVGTGVRFVATNGVVPVIVTTGSWASVVYYVEQSIQTEFITRGYTNPEGELSEYHGLLLDLQTWHGQFSVNLLSDGINEDVAVAADITKDRTRYYFPFDAAPYDATNLNNDFFTAGREDYSIQPTSAAYAFNPAVPQATGNVSGGLMQEAREPWDVTLAGRSCRVQLLGTRGRHRIGNIRLVETVDDQMAGPIAS